MTATATKKSPLNLGKLSAVAQIAVQKPMQAPDTELELSRIYSVKQVRRKFRNLEELAESFKLNGIIEPLVVHEEADGRFRIIVGERRFRAAPLAGLKKVPVIIKRGLTELEIRRMQITENNDRESLTPFEQAMGVIEDVEQYGIPEAMKIWNVKSEGWISKRVAVKRYADQVRELLEEELCGDFEVLHSLNQLYELSLDEFNHLMRRLKDGLPLSRDEARNKVAAVKVFQKEQAEFAKRRVEVRQAAAKPSSEKTAKSEQAAKTGAGDKVKGSAVKGQHVNAPTTAPSNEGVATAQRVQIEKALNQNRKDLFEWGETNLAHFNSMKTKMAELGIEMNEARWVLWSGFLSMVLPMLHSLGDEAAMLFVKKLQGEFKTKTPILMWRELHPLADGADPEDENGPRVEIPPMPEGWHF